MSLLTASFTSSWHFSGVSFALIALRMMSRSSSSLILTVRDACWGSGISGFSLSDLGELTPEHRLLHGGERALRLLLHALEKAAPRARPPAHEEVEQDAEDVHAWVWVVEEHHVERRHEDPC